MTCPKYEGAMKCKFHSLFYELSEETIAKFCTTSEYVSCREFIRSKKECELEQSAQSSPKLRPTTASPFLTRDQIAPLQDADVSCAYHETDDGGFLPK